MAIEIIEGYLGSGKTTFAVSKAMAAARRKKYKVICNFPVNHPDVIHGDWEMMRKATRAFCVIDEAPIWFSARNWSDTTEDEMERFRHSRHYECHIYLIAQHFEQLDKELRDRLAQYVWRVKRRFGPDEYDEPTPIERRIGCWSLCRKYHSFGYGTVHRQVCIEQQRIRLNDYFHLFDTKYIVGRKNDRLFVPPQSEAAAAQKPVMDRDKYLRCTQAMDEGRNGLTLWRPPLDDAIDAIRGTHGQEHEPNDAPGRPLVVPGKKWGRGS